MSFQNLFYPNDFSLYAQNNYCDNIDSVDFAGEIALGAAKADRVDIGNVSNDVYINGQLFQPGLMAGYSVVAPSAAVDNNGIIINNTDFEIELETASHTRPGIAALPDIYQQGTNNLFIGVDVADTVDAPENVGVGKNVLQDMALGAEKNCCFGNNAGMNLIDGYNNCFFGYNAGLENLSGHGNVFIGADSYIPDDTSTCFNNVFVGLNTGLALSTPGAYSNLIYIGSGVIGDTDDTVSGVCRIGNTLLKTFISGIRGKTTDQADAIPVLIDSLGQLGTASSSELVKENIHAITETYPVSDIIRDLKPVTFDYICNNNNQKCIRKKPVMGLIAEHTKTVLEDLVVGEEDEATIQYQHLPILLLAEVQRLQNENVQLKLAIQQIKIKLNML
jgi:hypothetical protein